MHSYLENTHLGRPDHRMVVPLAALEHFPGSARNLRLSKLDVYKRQVPYLHNAVFRAAPVVTKPTPEAARYDFNWLSATGTGCFFAAIVSGLLLGQSLVQLMRIFWRTLVRMRLAMVAISFMLGLGYVTRYSGLDAVLGLAFTRTGWLYPFFGTFLGWLGVALTGSDTSANALFGSLQRITSQQLGIDPILMCAANSAGGVMGKMVDAQSITIATAATEQVLSLIHI